uniref:Uncharacterized protein n=1 Tax=Schistocephalus solidus TaxID=70667 RepID=A0A0X3NS84_SCHSO
MGEFMRRVLSYPVISGTINRLGSALQWLLGADRYNNWFNFGQKTAAMVKDKTVSLAGNATMDCLDTIACRQILDRLESLIPQVNQSPEDVFTPLVERAINLAENFLDYFVNSPEPTTCVTNPPLSRADRLARLQSTVMNIQAVRSALSTSSSVYQKVQESIYTLLSLARRSPIEEQSDSATTSGVISFGSAVASLSNLLAQYQSAAVVAFPKFHSFIEGAVSQALQLLTEIRQNGPTEFIVEQLHALTRGLHTTLISLNTTRTAWIQDLLPQSSEEAGERSSEPAQADDESLLVKGKAAAAEISDPTPTSVGSESDINSASILKGQPLSATLSTTDLDVEKTPSIEAKIPTDTKKEEQSSEKLGSRKKLTSGATDPHEVPNQDSPVADTCMTREDPGKDSVCVATEADNLREIEAEVRKSQSKTHEHKPLTPTGAASSKGTSPASAEAQPNDEPQTASSEPAKFDPQVVGDGVVGGSRSGVQSHTGKKHIPAVAGGEHNYEGGLKARARSESGKVDSTEIGDGKEDRSHSATESHTMSPMVPEGVTDTPCDETRTICAPAQLTPDSQPDQCATSTRDSRVCKLAAESQQQHAKDATLEGINTRHNGEHKKPSKGKQNRGPNSGSRAKTGSLELGLNESIADALASSSRETSSKKPTTLTDTGSANLPSEASKSSQETACSSLVQPQPRPLVLSSQTESMPLTAPTTPHSDDEGETSESHAT